MRRPHSVFTPLPAVAGGSTGMARYSMRLRLTLVLGLVWVGSWLGQPTWAGGPGFTTDVSISGSHPDLKFTDLDVDEASWEICIDQSCDLSAGEVDQSFHISRVDAGTTASIPFIIENGAAKSLLHLDSSELIGINTATPAVELDIHSASPQIRLDDTSGGAGQVDFSLNTTTFMIEGTNDQDIIELSTSAPATMDIDSSGDTTFFGDLQVNSSREAKEAIEAVDGRDVLARLKQLPIHRWSYKKDAESVQHMGPMAEDFHAAFGLGQTDKHISVIDSAGVTLAAVQELALRVESLERENERLRNEMKEVRSSFTR